MDDHASPRSSQSTLAGTQKRHDGVIHWVGACISSVFFRFLKQCSCHAFPKIDALDDDDYEEFTNVYPLISTKPVENDVRDSNLESKHCQSTS